MKSFLFYHATSQASVVIITIALMLFTGYLMTRITRKFKLPNVTGYILAGILMGPYCLDMVPVKVDVYKRQQEKYLFSMIKQVN